MSTAGIYNYHPKVAHPNKVFEQMTSDTFQTPFYFGASQVPVNLGIEGSGFKTGYISSTEAKRRLSCQGRGIQTTANKSNKIFMPKTLKRI